MAKRTGQRQEAYEAGTRNVVPGQAWVEALARGLQRELFGADMGSPAGQRLREEMGSLGYEDALRQGYPEDYAMGRAAGSDAFDPLTLLAMRGMPLRSRALTGEVLAPTRMTPRMGAPRGAGPVIEGRATGPGVEDFAVRNGPYREVPIAPQTSGFERGAVAAAQRGRRGYGYGYEAPSYWEEGGQGFRPSIDDYVDVNVVRNPEGFYNQNLQDHLAGQMRAGNRQAMRSEMYGANGDRPAYGAGAEGKGYFGNMPNPGVNRGPRMERGPAPYGEAPASDGGFARMPRPGIRYDGRTEMGTGAGAPALNYEPVGPMGRGMVAGGERGMSGLPMLARGGAGRGLVPTEIQGEFYESPGIGYAGRGGGYNGSMDFGVTRDMPFGGEPGMPWGRAAMMAAPGAAVLYGGVEEEPGMRRAVLPTMNIGAHNPLAGQPEPTAEMPIVPISREPRREQAPVRAVGGPAGGGVRQGRPKAAGGKASGTKPVVQNAPVAQQGWEPNLNYIVTKALDDLLGQNEAERGRQFQQYYEPRGYQW